MDKQTCKILSNVSFVAGFASILASIAAWFFAGGKRPTAEEKQHGENFGIFVGIWAPTFFILSDRLAKYADELK